MVYIQFRVRSKYKSILVANTSEETQKMAENVLRVHSKSTDQLIFRVSSYLSLAGRNCNNFFLISSISRVFDTRKVKARLGMPQLAGINYSLYDARRFIRATIECYSISRYVNPGKGYYTAHYVNKWHRKHVAASTVSRITILTMA